MRGIIWVAVLAVASGNAFAQGRPSTLDMSCADARALVASKSAVVLGTGGRTFDRFFATRLFCSVLDEEAVARAVPTSDNPMCQVGYTCQPRPNND